MGEDKEVKLDGKYGFTLVELLVVISIIALLMAILMPALSRVKNQAKLLVCSTNCRQIGLIVSTYQADNDGYVPVVYNTAMPYPKLSFISLATASYWDIKLPSDFDPTLRWSVSQKEEYAEKYLPKQFICPYSVGKIAQASWSFSGMVYDGLYPNTVRIGRGESYRTWIHREIYTDVCYTHYPTGGDHGKPKYRVLPWHDAYGKIKQYAKHPYDELMKYPIRWGSQKCRPSETTVAFCEKGQFDGWAERGGYIRNYGSHKRENKGGTNSVFADGHVEWIEGTRIGW